eukprot:4951152-Pyramimonas_sp.AAC.1
MGPRMIALPCPAYPKETADTPWYSTGEIILVSGSIIRTVCSGEIIVGRDGPYTSASKMPTFAPIIASEYAKFTDTVDFPTPPLQLDTAMMWRTPLSPAG